MAADNRILLATRSAGKLRELRGILPEFGLTGISVEEAGLPVTAREDDLECFDTFEANALTKASYFHGLSDGMPALADDSGLCVKALNGAPGVWSKRYSGRVDLEGQALDDANNAKLLLAIQSLPRDASYSCAAAYVDGSYELIAMGETQGSIVDNPKGTNGFGYDPYFLSAELGVTFGEASLDAKAAISHRGRAFRELLHALRADGRR
ncbi:MAG TPA: non-canonical purine NTP pyrophosphatase [Gemmatimonadaceae bacterium]|nr:non-canonical purine NTP pyrophosphatase [Gemmatimonadaceae bacterium]